MRFQLGQQIQEVTSQALVNAAGPWVREVAARMTPRPTMPAVELVQGTHLELPGRIEHGCYYLEAPQDRRAVFVMPWHDRTLLGTTEVPFAGDPAQVAPTSQEVAYLLDVYRHYFPGRPRDVQQQWAGLRVLPAGDATASRRSRETQLPVDDPSQPRVVSIVGGKLTTYRSTAAKVLRLLAPTLSRRTPVADPRELPLVVCQT